MVTQRTASSTAGTAGRSRASMTDLHELLGIEALLLFQGREVDLLRRQCLICEWGLHTLCMCSAYVHVLKPGGRRCRVHLQTVVAKDLTQ